MAASDAQAVPARAGLSVRESALHASKVREINDYSVVVGAEESGEILT
ncbi:MAG: hypothetical protein JST11_06155 [Acidobacteria bacterium]|nr:hypothetical protein [Acidobacteriota bacterium]